MTHPGVDPVTALATDVFLGDPQRFPDGKALGSYVGMIPREYSSGARQRFGALTKQVNRCCVFSGEAAAHAARRDPDLQRFYRHKLVQKGLGKARNGSGPQVGDSSLDHVARPDRLSRVLSSWTDAVQQCRLCGDAWKRGWCAWSPAG
jgi:Transposase IS116/IS110/IS902 family